MTNFDLIALALLVLLFGGYQLFLFYGAEKLGLKTRESVIRRFRERWYDHLVESNQPILAIQTIRNLIMANTFLISISLLLMGGIVSIFSANLNWLTALERGLFSGFIVEHPAAIKLLISLLMLLIAAFNFTFSLRILYNMNYTMAVPEPGDHHFQHEQNNRQARHFVTGVRSLYYFIAPLLWVIDASLMILFLLVTTTLFVRFDFLRRD